MIKNIASLIFGFWIVFASNIWAQVPSATFQIEFKNVVKNEPMELYDKKYVNSFGEEYTIHKFRYYISNLSLSGPQGKIHQDSAIYLIDAAKPESQRISLHVPSGKYDSIHFQIGVDSIYNVSGAQSGPLDPALDMFWTWHTGYVMAKLEGISSASRPINGKYEYHIGGFSGKNKVLQQVALPLDSKGEMEVLPGSRWAIKIQADADAWFQGPNDLKISERAAINSPGKYAVAMSENYKTMFSISEIEKMP